MLLFLPFLPHLAILFQSNFQIDMNTGNTPRLQTIKVVSLDLYTYSFFSPLRTKSNIEVHRVLDLAGQLRTAKEEAVAVEEQEAEEAEEPGSSPKVSKPPASPAIRKSGLSKPKAKPEDKTKRDDKKEDSQDQQKKKKKGSDLGGLKDMAL